MDGIISCPSAKKTAEQLIIYLGELKEVTLI
jgi:hypothetical protein